MMKWWNIAFFPFSDNFFAWEESFGVFSGFDIIPLFQLSIIPVLQKDDDQVDPHEGSPHGKGCVSPAHGDSHRRGVLKSRLPNQCHPLDENHKDDDAHQEADKNSHVGFELLGKYPEENIEAEMAPLL